MKVTCRPTGNGSRLDGIGPLHVNSAKCKMPKCEVRRTTMHNTCKARHYVTLGLGLKLVVGFELGLSFSHFRVLY